jgi:hypothetical protein
MDKFDLKKYLVENRLKENSSYYQGELDNLNTNSTYPISIKLTDGDGNSTKYINLNNESIPVLIEWLKQLPIK